MTYKFSEESIRQIQKNFLIAAGASSFFILLLIVFINVRADQNTKWLERSIFTACVSAVLIGTTGYFIFKKVKKQLQSMTLKLNKDSICFFGVDKTKEVLFSGITRLIIYKNPPSVLMVANNKKYEIFGYEKMDEIGEAVADKVDIALIKRVTHKFNIYNSINIIVVGLCTLIGIGLYMVVFEKLGLVKFCDPFFMILSGGYLAFFLPETAPKFVKNTGWALIAISIVYLTLVLFFKWDGLPVG